MVVIILSVFAVFFFVVVYIGWTLSSPGYKGPVSDHFNGNNFTNPSGAEAKGFTSLLKWGLRRDQGPWVMNYETFVGPPPVKNSKNLLVTFVNHSTFLIQWNELNILTDPVWSERCSPSVFAGPRRMRPPGINFDDLPPIDLVLLSHNHYDHLDISTLKKINELHSPAFITPLGVGNYLNRNGIDQTVELDWWDNKNAGLKITCVPAQHFSSRGMFDRDKTLWAGFVLEHEEQKLYFAGDSGYGNFFKEIGKRLGPFDLSLIPIGAYLPKWFMSPIHVSPIEAIQIHQDVGSRQSIAMHFGTFALADEGQGKAQEDLIIGLQQAGIEQENFIIPEEGIAMSIK